jgi:mono/diheme cytochrome c family protein
MRFLVGFVIGLIIVPAAVFVYFRFGFAPVATAANAMPFEKQFARWDLHSVVEREMPRTVPIPANEANYTNGAQVYRTHCAVCHGLPGQELSAIANGEFPKPPHLFKGHGVTDDPPGETYWKIENGIRLTGMPGFGKALTQTQMWQISLLLANADKLPPSVDAILRQPLEVK